MSALGIDLYNALSDSRINNYTCLLFRLFLKADPMNLRKLGLVYPDEYQFFSGWQRAADPDQYLRNYPEGKL